MGDIGYVALVISFALAAYPPAAPPLGETPVRGARPASRGRPGGISPPAEQWHALPPADALPGLRGVCGPLRLRNGRPFERPPGQSVDPRQPALDALRLG